MTILSKPKKTSLLLTMLAIMLGNQISSAKWIPIDEHNDKKTNAKINIVSKNQDGKAIHDAIDKIRQIDINISIPGVDATNTTNNSDIYQKLEIPGINAQSVEIGKPAVPVYIFMQEVPFGSVPTVSIESVDEKVISDINVIPAQEPQPDIAKHQSEFSKDQKTYSSTQTYPESYLLKSETITMRNHQFVRLEIALAKSRPASMELLLISSMKIAIQLKHNGKGASVFQKSHSFDGLFNSGNSTADLIPSGTGGAPERYMILMDDQFDTNSTLNTFIEWKSRKGYDVDVVKTSQINSSGAPDSSEIQAFMLSLPDSLYPTYLLIIGDQTADNGVDGWFRYSEWSYYIAYGYHGFTDLYYTIRDTSNFPVPDLFYGRIPARDNAELTLILQKAIDMDRTPPVNDMYDKALVAGMLQDYNDTNNVADRLFCETADAIASYFEIDPSNIGYSCTRSLVRDPGSVDSNCLWNPNSILWNNVDRIGSRVANHFLNGGVATARISSQIDSGISIVFHRDHGNYDGWGDPSFRVSNVNALTNGVARPLVYSLNCLTGGYHENWNFTRSFLQHDNGGAYAVIAAVDLSYSWANDWMAHGLLMGLFDDYRTMINTATVPNEGVNWSKTLQAPSQDSMSGLIEGKARKLGQNLHFGKVYLLQRHNSSLRTTFEIFHVFGDPEGDIVLHTPQIQTVSHPTSISTGSQSVVVVTDNDSVQVCLYSEALGIHLVALSQNDSAVFNINPSSSGEIRVTATGFGKRPYEGVISVTNGNNQLFGFDDPSLWSFTVGSGILSSNTTQKTEGTSSMVYGGNNYREITSVAVNTSDISNESSTIALDLYVGTTQPNPYWIGEIAMFISCPSAGIYHLNIGNHQLNSLPRGVFNTVNFNLPSNVVNVLTNDHSDFRFSIVLNTNVSSGPYLVDNMRFVP